MTTSTSTRPSASLAATPAQLRFLLLEQGLGAGVVNFLLNGLFAWASYRALADVPMWGSQSIAGDTIATSVILPVITCLVLSVVVRKKVASGGLEALPWTRETHPSLAFLPQAPILRGVALGVASAATAASLTLVVLHVAGVDSLPLSQFLLFKASYAAVLGALVSPLAAALTLAAARKA